MSPTAQGLKRYPLSNGYNLETVDPIPCMCIPSCPERCAGECGCEACAVQFASFCDMSGRFGADVPTSEAEEEALAAYRAI